MRIDIVTAVPELLQGPLTASIVKKGVDKGLVSIHIHNLRDYASGNYRQVDDYPFGGGGGMVLMVEPIFKCIEALKAERDYDEVIYTAPDAEPYDQKAANRLSLSRNLLILCGHYKGVDQRVRDHLVTQEYSIGDFVISGGELAAAMITDSLVRLIPGVLGDEISALTDSFQDSLLAPPVYTRPAEFRGWAVPDILLSGNTPEIEKWREQRALDITREKRPDLLE